MKSIRIHIQFLLLAFAVLLCAAALYGYMYWSVDVKTDRALSARDIALSEEKDESQEKEMMGLYLETATQRDRLRSYFIDEEDMVSFIEAIEALGPKSGAKIKISSLSLAHAHVEAVGSWNSVMRALKLSETMPYNVVVSNVRLALDSNSKTPSWQLSYEIKTEIVSN